MSLPMVEELRTKVRSRVMEVRESIRARIPALRKVGPKFEIGEGKLIERAKTRIEEIRTRVKELRPQVLPRVPEFRPGRFIETFLKRGQLAPQVVTREGMSIVGEAAKKEFTDALSIEL